MIAPLAGRYSYSSLTEAASAVTGRCVGLQEPLGDILQELEAVIAGHVPEDRQRVLKLRWCLRARQRPSALVAIPPQVSLQHLNGSFSFSCA